MSRSYFINAAYYHEHATILFLRDMHCVIDSKTQVTLSNYHTTSNDSEVRSVTETQNVPEGIYSLLQQEDMITVY